MFVKGITFPSASLDLLKPCGWKNLIIITLVQMIKHLFALELGKYLIFDTLSLSHHESSS